MIKPILTLVVMFTILIFAAEYLVTSAFESASEIEAIFQNQMGVKVIIDNDTLTVTDYDVLSNTLKLSNGQEIATSYYDKLTQVP